MRCVCFHVHALITHVFFCLKWLLAIRLIVILFLSVHIVSYFWPTGCSFCHVCCYCFRCGGDPAQPGSSSKRLKKKKKCSVSPPWSLMCHVEVWLQRTTQEEEMPLPPCGTNTTSCYITMTKHFQFVFPLFLWKQGQTWQKNLIWTGCCVSFCY